VEGQLKQMKRFVENIQVNIKQVWKRKDNGLLVRVNGLIFLEPKRVMWQALPNQNNQSASGILTETEFKERFEWRLGASSSKESEQPFTKEYRPLSPC